MNRRELVSTLAGRTLKRVGFEGWICPDLDHVRVSASHSFTRCRAYVREKLEPIYR